MDNLPEDNNPQSIAAQIERIVRSWRPRHRGTGRILEPVEFHPIVAAAHVATPEVYKDDPNIIERFLREAVGLEQVGIYEIWAYWEFMREAGEKPYIALDSRFRNVQTTLEYLAEEVRKRKKNLEKQIRYDERPRRTYTANMRRAHPVDLQNLPHQRIEGKYRPITDENRREPHDDLEGLVEWSEEENERFLREAKQVLPRRQFQVLERRYWGQTNKEIARDLGITESMVRDHHAAGRRNRGILKLASRWMLGKRI